MVMFVLHRGGGAGRLSGGRDRSARSRDYCGISGICGGNHSNRNEQDGAAGRMIIHNICHTQSSD